MCAAREPTPLSNGSVSVGPDHPTPEHTSSHFLMAWCHLLPRFSWGEHRASWQRLTVKPETSETLKPVPSPFVFFSSKPPG